MPHQQEHTHRPQPSVSPPPVSRPHPRLSRPPMPTLSAPCPRRRGPPSPRPTALPGLLDCGARLRTPRFRRSGPNPGEACRTGRRGRKRASQAPYASNSAMPPAPGTETTGRIPPPGKASHSRGLSAAGSSGTPPIPLFSSVPDARKFLGFTGRGGSPPFLFYDAAAVSGAVAGSRVRGALTRAVTEVMCRANSRGIDITGESGPVQRFRQLIGTMATVVDPA